MANIVHFVKCANTISTNNTVALGYLGLMAQPEDVGLWQEKFRNRDESRYLLRKMRKRIISRMITEEKNIRYFPLWYPGARASNSTEPMKRPISSMASTIRLPILRKALLVESALSILISWRMVPSLSL